MASSPSPLPHCDEPTSPLNSNSETLRGHEEPLQANEEAAQTSPSWKRPSLWWLIFLAFFGATAMSVTSTTQLWLAGYMLCRMETRGLQYEASYPAYFTLFDFGNTPTTLLQTHSTTSMSSHWCSSNPGIIISTAFNFFAVASAVSWILAYVTVAWWGSFSDRHGRCKMLAISAIGQLVYSLFSVLLASYIVRLPDGYQWWLLVGAVIAGALGGSESQMVAFNAYIADISAPEKRSRAYSAVQGFTLAGGLAGFTLSKFIAQITDNTLSCSSITVVLNFIYLLLICYALPESRTTSQMRRASLQHREDRQHSIVRRIYSFIKPFAVLSSEESSRQGLPTTRKWDRNVLALVLAHGLILFAAASYILQLQYALSTFREYFRFYWMTVSYVRVVYLVLVLPAVITFAQRHNATRIEGPPSERDPLLSNRGDSENNTNPNQSIEFHSSVFDLHLARFSAWVNILTFMILPAAPNGLIYTVFSALGACGAGITPAVNSLLFDLYRQKSKQTNFGAAESGKLFGVLSVVYSLFAVLGQYFYAFGYSSTVSTFPQAIFFVAMGNAAVALAFLFTVRLSPVRGRAAV